MLTDSGVRLVKLFLHIASKEQARRFRDRLINPLKRWKLSYEDFRNRTRRAEYVVAIEDMLEEISTKFAPSQPTTSPSVELWRFAIAHP